MLSSPLQYWYPVHFWCWYRKLQMHFHCQERKLAWKISSVLSVLLCKYHNLPPPQKNKCHSCYYTHFYMPHCIDCNWWHNGAAMLHSQPHRTFSQDRTEDNYEKGWKENTINKYATYLKGGIFFCRPKWITNWNNMILQPGIYVT